MKDPELFALVCIMDDALMWHWSFRAPDELAVARHLLCEAWSYQDVFWALRIHLKDVDALRPEDLLQAIRDSYTNMHTPAVLYLLPISQPANCVEAERQAPRV